MPLNKYEAEHKFGLKEAYGLDELQAAYENARGFNDATREYVGEFLRAEVLPDASIEEARDLLAAPFTELGIEKMECDLPVPYRLLEPDEKALVDDEDYKVRLQAVKKGFGLDRLVSDADGRIRRRIADEGYALEFFAIDEEVLVRMMVASKGYAIDRLANDEAIGVRRAVAKYFKEHPEEVPPEGFSVEKHDDEQVTADAVETEAQLEVAEEAAADKQLD